MGTYIVTCFPASLCSEKTLQSLSKLCVWCQLWQLPAELVTVLVQTSVDVWRGISSDRWRGHLNLILFWVNLVIHDNLFFFFPTCWHKSQFIRMRFLYVDVPDYFCSLNISFSSYPNCHCNWTSPFKTLLIAVLSLTDIIVSLCWQFCNLLCELILYPIHFTQLG